MSKNIAWFPFYMGDYLKDTQHLTTIEHGMYLKFMLFYYSHGKPIPHARRYDISSASSTPQALLEGVNTHAMCDQILSDFFIRDGDVWRHKRIEAELKRQQELNERYTERAKKGAAARHAKESASSKPQADIKQVHSQSHNGVIKPLPLGYPQAGEGSLKKSGTKGLGYDVWRLLDSAAELEAKKNAQGWDLLHLAGIYNENINSGRMEKPKLPRRAFPAWCASYTKGKPPA